MYSMVSRQTRRQSKYRKNKRGGDFFSQTLRSFGVPGLGPSTSQVAKDIIKEVTLSTTPEKIEQIRKILKMNEGINKENLKRDLKENGVSLNLIVQIDALLPNNGILGPSHLDYDRPITPTVPSMFE